MRVAMIGPFGLRPKGTMSVRALPLAKALARRGHEVALFLPPWSFPQDAGKTWDEDGVHIENVPVSPRALIGPRLVSRALAWQPDVIHSFKPKAYAGLAAWQVWQLRRLGRAHVRLVVDTDDWEGAGGWNEIENYPGALKRFFAWQELWGLKHNHAVTVASRALETIVLSLGRAPREVYYLPNGTTNLPTLEPIDVREKYGLHDAPVVLLYTRFFEFRIERLMQVWARITEQVPGAQLLVVGRGLFGEEKELLALAREQRMGERLKYAGWVEPGQLASFFAAADIALYPFDDTLVNRCKCAVKLIDLLAAGVPVVAEAVGQNKEYIAHGENGLLVSPGRVEEFACAAASLLHDRSLRQRLGSRARAAMAANFSWDRLSEIAERAYLDRSG